jgi:tetratricopeptide (TPR) repeat protein
MSLFRTSVSALALCLLTSHVLGQSTLTNAPTAVSAEPELQPAATQPRNPAIDESALRYFARQGDEKRLQAEIARLAALYPGWVAPSDPTGTADAVDTELQAMWDLYGEGDLEGVQAAIAARAEREPGWRAPDDLASALGTGSAAAKMRAAATVQDYNTVIELAAQHSDLLVCEHMDLLWTVAEAFVDTRREARSLDTYSYILANCTAAAERIATMQKAGSLLQPEDLNKLFAFEKDREFQPIRVDLARRAVADHLNGVSRHIDAAALALLEEAAEAAPTAEDLRLLGYHELKEQQPRRAREWFEQAVELDDSVESISGLAMALTELRDLTGAEEFLAEYRFDTPELEEQYLNVANALLSGEPPKRLSEEVLERIIESVDEARSADGAHSLGWYAYNFGQAQTAARWFEEALEYNPEFEPAAYGLLVANQKLRNRDQVRAIIRQWGPVSPRIELFGKPGAPTKAPERYVPAPQPRLAPAVYRLDQGPAFILAATLTPAQRRASAQCGTFAPAESFSANAAVGRGWCLLELERAAEAEAAFRRGTQSASTKVRTDAYYGLALALLRLGLVEDAAVAAAAMPQSAERVNELQVSILSSTAVAYFEIGRYEEVLQLLDQRAMLAPEQNDLLTIRAWSYYHLGRLREARQIFAAVAATGYPDAQKGLDAIAAKNF